MRILVVEDDPAVRSSLARALRLEGYDAELHEEGISAIRSLQVSAPDAIVLYERALGLVEGTETGVEARVLDGLGAVYARAGRQADADRALHRAEAIRKILAAHGAG